jgi:inner membrane protein
MEPQPPFPQVPFQLPQQKKNKPSITIKLLVIAALIVMLVIPWGLLQLLIYSREQMGEKAVAEVSQKWSDPQLIRGPVLYVPYGLPGSTPGYLKILPDDLHISGTITPEKRYRGIYEVAVYSAKLSCRGKMKIPAFELMKLNPDAIHWKDAFVGIGITDMRGIRENINLNWGGTNYVCNPGIEASEDAYTQPVSGVSAMINMSGKDTLPGTEIPFSFEINLNGSKNLDFEPLGKVTSVHLVSTWNDPGFAGAFLPDNPKIYNAGF